MAFQYETVNSGGMSTHYHARSLIKFYEKDTALKIKRLFFLLIIALLVGCARQGDTISVIKITRVSIILPEQNDAYWSEIKNELYREIAREGTESHADYKVLTPAVSYNEDLILELVQQQIAAKVDVLVIPGMDSKRMKDALEEAMNRGSKVICIDTDIPEIQNHLYIGTDNESAGELMARKAIELCRGNATITVVLGDEDSMNQKYRLDGFQKELSKYPDMRIRNVVYDQYDGVVFVEIFNANQSSDTLICLEGTGAKVLGTVNVHDELPYDHILGFDHSDAVDAGMMDGVVVQDINAMGKAVVDAVEQYAVSGEMEDGAHYTSISFYSNRDALEK